MDLSKRNWAKDADHLQFRGEALIGGKRVWAQSGKTFPCMNPATGASLADIAACNDLDVNLAVNSARAAYEDGRWSRKSPEQRKAVLLEFSKLIAESIVELALLDSLDMGKLVMDAATVSVQGTSQIFQWYAEAIDKVYDEVAPFEQDRLVLVRRQALGVVGAVVPWNFPLDMAAWKCAPALAIGNSVVLKPAEQSPLSAMRLAELALEAGIPEGVLNVVPGTGEITGKAVGLHPDIDCVAFTGSTEVGKLFQTYAGQSNMKQVWLECGGKSPNVVFADCEDLNAVAEITAMGIFFNQGQNCSANSRVYVESSIAETFTEKLAEQAKSYKPGNPLDTSSTLGAIVDEKQTRRIMDYIEGGKKTARLVAGGEQVTVDGKGFYIQPTIFADVSQDDRLSRDEIFGPVLAISTFETEEEAITRANDSIYGLAASVWTSSLGRAHRLAERLHVGTVSVNTVDAFSPMTPFGGFKQSGFGRDLSLHALDKFSGLKTTWIEF